MSRKILVKAFIKFELIARLLSLPPEVRKQNTAAIKNSITGQLFLCRALNIYVSIVADAVIVLFDGLRTEYKVAKIIKINIIEVIKIE